MVRIETQGERIALLCVLLCLVYAEELLALAGLALALLLKRKDALDK
jgi:hypothetical protein